MKTHKIGNTTIYDVEQGHPEWTQLRVGKLTASKVKSILNLDCKLKAKGPLNTQLCKILAEIETGFSMDSDYVSDAMEWGSDHEEEVIEKYRTDMYEPIGFATNSKFKYLGCSPDMIFYNENGTFRNGAEIKCPASHTHISYDLNESIPNEHKHQVYTYFLIFDTLDAMTFISYDPRNTKREEVTRVIYRKDIQAELDQMEESIIRFEFLIDQHNK